MTTTVPAMPTPRGQRVSRSDDHRSISCEKRDLGLIALRPLPAAARAHARAAKRERQRAIPFSG